jgi:transcriptional antiterminator NusG
MDEYIGRCVVPVEKVTEKKNGKKRTVERKFFPGYVIAELAFYRTGEDAAAKAEDDTARERKPIYDKTWQFLRATPGLIGFVGGDQPIPLTDREIESILLDKPSEAGRAARPKISYSVDETVKVTDGPFMGMTGVVSMVDPDKGKMQVEVNIFNRKVQVDVEYWQVEKVAVEETFEART